VDARVGFKLYLITDRRQAAARGGLPAVCEAALSAANDAGHRGAVAIQLREKDLPARELYALALAMRELCARFDAQLLINDRIDVAIACGADGVHLPVDSFAIADARRLLGPGRLIGVSTHEAGEVRAAAQGGADFAVFGPVYVPLSKARTGPARGIAALRAACHAAVRPTAPGAVTSTAAAPMPVYALGGITAERVHELGPDPAGVAVIGAVFGAESPGPAVRSLLEALSVSARQ
jgi:thiamine-phosphate pyrophosphorylase